MREAGRGLVAAVAALLAMAVVAAAGLALLGAGRGGDLGALTAAAVALAVGGTAEVGATPAAGLPVAVRGGIEVMPLGVSLAGAAVLAWLLLRRRESGLLVRGAVAAVALPIGLCAFALPARGKLPLPDGVATGGCVRSGGSPRLPRSGALDAGFSVAAGPTVVGAAVWTLVVLAACWAVTRFPALTRVVSGKAGSNPPYHSRRRRGRRTLWWLAGGSAVLGVAAAWAFGGPAAAGAVLLVLPQLVFGVLLLGLGVPWTVTTTGLASCAPDLPPGGLASWVTAAVLLACGVAARSRRPGDPLRRAVVSAARLAPAAAAVLAAGTLLSRASLEVAVSAFGMSFPVFDARLTANPLLALVAGLAGGAVAGFAGSLLADGISVSSRAWKR
ncbi:streptophobe family protein [Amycolatopsis sp. A133]|uniref:streptophobe family protein n=1 Tax=Amycolatopsis sp. A133 TaxID=3064472 RepID=UPI0027F83EB9|nr:streptophobe family protein [Amycolatopsis sp. A133]MDQ7808668.1 streptophobe family protein [Amycolatopsis sp. A133]